MAEPQPRNVHEGATGDVEDEVQTTAKSAEDRKAAAAMANLDARGDDASTPGNAVDQEAVSKAMKSLGSGAPVGTGEKKEVKKVKVDAADVALLIDELDLTKVKATEILKAHDGDAVQAMKAFIAAIEKKWEYLVTDGMYDYWVRQRNLHLGKEVCRKPNPRFFDLSPLWHTAADWHPSRFRSSQGV
ncbi:hypothetical protein GGR54DRAFT_453656 [Hypoxylon sp. NC1633]|nr:hypothetical protein GGR54DRAFT_453656 [Hypoxylon sp. NC1633]